MKKIYCGQCGFENNGSNKFCTSCGALLTQPNEILTIEKKHSTNKAKTTPKIETDNKKSQVKGIFMLIVIGIVMIGYCTRSNHNTSSKSNENATQEIVSNSAWDASVSQVEQFLKTQYLKDPDSYQGIEWSKVQIFQDNPRYKYMVRHKFRAKNSFGGYVVENKVFYLDAQGTVVDYKDFE